MALSEQKVWVYKLNEYESNSKFSLMHVKLVNRIICSCGRLQSQTACRNIGMYSLSVLFIC
jgi:hypothetical protein